MVWTSFMVDRRRGGLGSSALRQALPYQFPSNSSCVGLCACFVARAPPSIQSKHHLTLLHTWKNAQAAVQQPRACSPSQPSTRSIVQISDPAVGALPSRWSPHQPHYPPFVNRLGLATRMLESPHQGPSHPASEPWMTHVRLTILARRSRGRCHQVCDRRTGVVTDCT